MNLVDLTLEIIKRLVKEPDVVSVKEFESDKEDEMIIQVIVSSNDIGRVIGREGKTANAIRTLVQASSYINENKKIRINIDSF